jgi:hypothetical protein
MARFLLVNSFHFHTDFRVQIATRSRPVPAGLIAQLINAGSREARAFLALGACFSNAHEVAIGGRADGYTCLS